MVVAGHTPSIVLDRYGDVDPGAGVTEDGEGRIVRVGASELTGGVPDRINIDCSAAAGAGQGRVGILREEHEKPVLGEGDGRAGARHEADVRVLGIRLGDGEVGGEGAPTDGLVALEEELDVGVTAVELQRAVLRGAGLVVLDVGKEGLGAVGRRLDDMMADGEGGVGGVAQPSEGFGEARAEIEAIGVVERVDDHGVAPFGLPP